jgi:transposase
MRAVAKELHDRDVYEQMSTMGMFVLVSTRRVGKSKILPAYYTRQQIEQIFDIGKNYAGMLPLRVHKEETFRGHLLLTFVASVIVKMIQDKLNPTSYNPISMFLNLRNQKCKLYEKQVITQEAFKKANDCYKLFGIKCPLAIQLKKGIILP